MMTTTTMTTPHGPLRGVTLTLRPLPGVGDAQAVQSLRAILKRMRRQYGWECTRLEVVAGPFEAPRGEFGSNHPDSAPDSPSVHEDQRMVGVVKLLRLIHDHQRQYRPRTVAEAENWLDVVSQAKAVAEAILAFKKPMPARCERTQEMSK